MPSLTVLVLGGTGPAGINLLRELLHRKHKVVAYARNPQKVPEDLASHPSLEASLTYDGNLERRKQLTFPDRQGRSVRQGSSRPSRG
jgi:uncharacterized protein YbjT (DUF2867 family)